jgi:hypothetical protein
MLGIFGAMTATKSSTPSEVTDQFLANVLHSPGALPERRSDCPKLRHRNPVKHDLVSQPDLWIWSSFRSYANGEAGVMQINQ